MKTIHRIAGTVGKTLLALFAGILIPVLIWVALAAAVKARGTKVALRKAKAVR